MGQRPNGIPREKVCQFKLVLLGEWKGERGREGGRKGRWGKGVMTWWWRSELVCAFVCVCRKIPPVAVLAPPSGDT